MTSILAIFIFALVLSLVLTPLAGKLGERFGALDVPDHRKVHERPIPRSGGIAIFIAFFATIYFAGFFDTNVTNQLSLDRQTAFLLGGAIICFGVGVFDDFRRLGFKVKFVFQIMAASMAYWGGLDFGNINILGLAIDFGPLSYFATIFWFVLLINSINLIDGLDGLAGGVIVFASLVMIVLSIMKGSFVTAIFFAALGGGVLGFLRYNFNPATVFLGDGGTYFLGYAIAGLSLMGSVKTQVGTAILIPLLALGVPLFDTILSPMRRFVVGQKMFNPDNGHIHHKLLEIGFTKTKAVWLLYLITLGLCLSSILVVNIRDEQAGLFLIILGLGVVVFVRKLGYFEYIGSDKVYGWFKDMTDVSGISHDRRSFLGLQMAINKSRNRKELWSGVVEASKILGLDYIEMKLFGQEAGFSEDRSSPGKFKSGELEPDMLDWDRVLYMILPLADREKRFGSIAVAKDLFRSPLTPFTLRRIEQLRRAIISTLQKWEKEAEKESKEKSISYMESSRDGYLLFDSELKLVEINKSGLSHFMMTREETINKDILDIMPDVKENGNYARYMEVLKTGKQYFTDDVIHDSMFDEIRMPVKAFKVGDGLGIVMLLPS